MQGRVTLDTEVVVARARHQHSAILTGGISLIVGALSFLAVFFYLAAQFDYPNVLDGNSTAVLPALLDTGAAGRGAWAFYGLLPLVFVPAGIGAYEALREYSAGMMRIAAVFAALAALTMMLGLLRWPSIHWALALAWGDASPEQRVILTTIFDGLNLYLGNYIGEFVGELCFSVFFALSGIALLRDDRAPNWLGWCGIATGGLGLIGLWRNVTPAVDVVAALNNYLLPAWMIAFGTWLIMEGRRPRPAESIA